MSISRRALLAAGTGAIAATASGLLSACSSGGGGGGAAAASGRLEVFSWWTAGGEKDALNSLVAEFHQTYPKIAFVNEAVAGGAGANAEAELARRLKAHNPPDTFQAQAGAMLADYVDAGQLEDLSFLYKQQGWDKAFNPTVLKLIQRGGKFYSVPVDLHHINVLWSNLEVCNRLKVNPKPTSTTEFVEQLQKVKKDSKVVPLAIGLSPDQNWQVKHLMETLLIAALGATAWTSLWSVGGTSWSDPRITTALEQLTTILSLVPAGTTYSWDEACAQVAGGKAAYQVMGDWTEGLFTVDYHLVPHQDYEFCPAPGTAGIFDFASDCFTLPVGAPHRADAIAWLTQCGSQGGQDAFTTVKGAIPPRASFDATEKRLFDTYSLWSMQQWQSCTVVGSLTHGVMARASWNAAIDTAITAFVKDRDPQTLQSALVAAGQKYAV